MSGLGVRPVHRVRGRQVLERRLRALLIALHRFRQHRATSAADFLWTARAIDEIESLLASSSPRDSQSAATMETRS